MIGFAFVLYLCGLAGCDTVRYYVDECTAEAYADLRTEAWLRDWRYRERTASEWYTREEILRILSRDAGLDC